jgi:hypothetical protein
MTMKWNAQKTAGYDKHGQMVVYEEQSGNDIAIVYDGDDNARLIAAAPELLEVLKRIMLAVDNGRWSFPAELGILASNAIAKAEGRDS